MSTDSRGAALAKAMYTHKRVSGDGLFLEVSDVQEDGGWQPSSSESASNANQNRNENNNNNNNTCGGGAKNAKDCQAQQFSFDFGAQTPFLFRRYSLLNNGLFCFADSVIAADKEFESYVRLCDLFEYCDTLTLAKVLLERGVRSHFERLLNVVTRGNFLCDPCGVRWDERASRWRWKAPKWFSSMGYYSFATYVAHKLEMAIWMRYMQAHGVDPRLVGGSTSAAAMRLRPYTFPTTKTRGLHPGLHLIEFWNQMSLEEKRQKVLADVGQLIDDVLEAEQRQKQQQKRKTLLQQRKRVQSADSQRLAKKQKQRAVADDMGLSMLPPHLALALASSSSPPPSSSSSAAAGSNGGAVNKSSPARKRRGRGNRRNRRNRNATSSTTSSAAVARTGSHVASSSSGVAASPAPPPSHSPARAAPLAASSSSAAAATPKAAAVDDELEQHSAYQRRLVALIDLLLTLCADNETDTDIRNERVLDKSHYEQNESNFIDFLYMSPLHRAFEPVDLVMRRMGMKIQALYLNLLHMDLIVDAANEAPPPRRNVVKRARRKSGSSASSSSPSAPSRVLVVSLSSSLPDVVHRRDSQQQQQQKVSKRPVRGGDDDEVASQRRASDPAVVRVEFTSAAAAASESDTPDHDDDDRPAAVIVTPRQSVRKGRRRLSGPIDIDNDDGVGDDKSAQLASSRKRHSAPDLAAQFSFDALSVAAGAVASTNDDFEFQRQARRASTRRSSKRSTSQPRAARFESGRQQLAPPPSVALTSAPRRRRAKSQPRAPMAGAVRKQQSLQPQHAVRARESGSYDELSSLRPLSPSYVPPLASSAGAAAASSSVAVIRSHSEPSIQSHHLAAARPTSSTTTSLATMSAWARPVTQPKLLQRTLTGSHEAPMVLSRSSPSQQSSYALALAAMPWSGSTRPKRSMSDSEWHQVPIARAAVLSPSPSPPHSPSRRGSPVYRVHSRGRQSVRRALPYSSSSSDDDVMSSLCVLATSPPPSVTVFAEAAAVEQPAALADLSPVALVAAASDDAAAASQEATPAPAIKDAPTAAAVAAAAAAAVAKSSASSASSRDWKRSPTVNRDVLVERHHQQDAPGDYAMPEWLRYAGSELPAAASLAPKGGESSKAAARRTSSAPNAGSASVLFHHPSFDASMADSMMMHVLHEEIEQFVAYTSSITSARAKLQRQMIGRLQSLVARLWRSARVAPYGSFATDLSIPSSDLDLVVAGVPRANYRKLSWNDFSSAVPSTPLRALVNVLKKQSWLRRIQPIERARVPVIKLVAEIGGALLHIDITFDYSATSTPKSLSPSSSSSSPLLSDVLRSSAAMAAASSSADNTSSSSNNTSRYPLELLRSNSSSSELSSARAHQNQLTAPASDQRERSSSTEFVRRSLQVGGVVHRGQQAVELVRGYIDEYPAVRPLAIVLKQFLAERALNNTYTGGLSSYCLVLILVSFLKFNAQPGDNLGTLLLNFLTFFGTQFDFHKMGISLRPQLDGGGYFALAVPCPTLVIEDPFDVHNNIGKNVFAMYRIKAAFHFALSRLVAPYPPRFAPTLLSRIIHGPPRLHAQRSSSIRSRISPL
jgi:Poly(A) RNA polymerase, mitochondrial-like, central palm domain/Cid1 family poly A polymerase